MEFAKGVSVRERKFENGGSVFNISLNMEELMLNPVNQEKYINLTLKQGKESGKWYAVNNEYYQKEG